MTVSDTSADAITYPVGGRLKFDPDRRWWAIRAASPDGRYTVCTRQADFQPKGEVFYTIIDQQEGVRGPCNRIGQGWDRYMDDTACSELVDALVADDVEVSHRNRLPIDVVKVEAIS